MKKFVLKYGYKLIGFSSLESSDPPMGVVLGDIQLADNFAISEFIELVRNDQDSEFLDDESENEGLYLIHLGPQFSLHCQDGEKLNPIGLTLEVYRNEIQISAYGIDYQQFAKLFPQHLSDYEMRFKNQQQ